VLGLAGTESAFFLAAPVVLCFGSVAPTALTTHQCLDQCWAGLAQCPGLLCFPLRPTASAGRGHAWDRYSMLCTLTLSNNSWGRGRKRWGFCFPGGCCLETGWASVCLWEVVCHPLRFALIHPLHFLHLLNCFYLDSRIVLILFFLFSLPVRLRGAGEGSERAAVGVLGCQPGKTHPSQSYRKAIPEWCIILFSDSSVEFATIFSDYNILLFL